MSERYPLAALYTALAAARKATQALVRNDVAPGTARRGPFTFPSQESVQEAWYHAESEHGLLLLDRGQEKQESGDVLYSWVLVHVESGDSLPFDLCWPMPQGEDDDLEEQHARAACWSHAERHLICHLLRARIEGADPAVQPWAKREKRSDDLPAWSETKVSPAAVNEAYSEAMLEQLVAEWARRKAEEDRAAGRPVKKRGLRDAYLARVEKKNGAEVSARIAKEPIALEDGERRTLFFWLLDVRAGVE
jgi:hypothetical protein